MCCCCLCCRFRLNLYVFFLMLSDKVSSNCKATMQIGCYCINKLASIATNLLLLSLVCRQVATSRGVGNIFSRAITRHSRATKQSMNPGAKCEISRDATRVQSSEFECCCRNVVVVVVVVATKRLPQTNINTLSQPIGADSRAKVLHRRPRLLSPLSTTERAMSLARACVCVSTR